MKIGVVKVAPGNSKLGMTQFFAFDRRLERHVRFEMKGLGVEGQKVKSGLRPTASDNCTLYILKNGVQVFKYGFRYAILAANDRALADTAKLLKIKVANMVVADPDSNGS